MLDTYRSTLSLSLLNLHATSIRDESFVGELGVDGSL